MVDDKLVENIFGWIGLAISTYFYMSPVVPYVKVLKGEKYYKDAPCILLICNLLNCIIWTDYGLLEDSLQLYLTCSIGATITLIWITIYLLFLSKKKFFLTLFLCILLLGVIAGIAYVFYEIIDFKITGYVALVINILMLAAPGEKIYTVFKTGNYELIPIFSTIGTLLCAGCWFMFGVYQDDLNLYIPNGLGLIFGVFQLIVYCCYYQKSKKTLSDDENDDVV